MSYIQRYIPGTQIVNGAYVAEDLADLKSLIHRPEAVIVKTGRAKGVWQLGTQTTADDSLIANPTTGTAVSYYRIFDGIVYFPWFGTAGDGTTDDATAITAALASGYPVSGQDGDIYAFNGPITLPAGAVIQDAAFKLLNPNASAAQNGFVQEKTGTPAATFTASITDDVMTVSSGSGLAVGQRLSVVATAGLLAGTEIVEQDSGTPGGAGDYTVSRAQSISSTTFEAFVPEAGPKLTNIKFDRNGTTTDASLSAASIYLAGLNGVVVQDCEIFGDGKGKGIQVEDSIDVDILGNYLHDMEWSNGTDPGSEQIIGVFVYGNDRLRVNDNTVLDLTGLVGGNPARGSSTPQQTDGLSYGGNTRVQQIGNFIRNCGEGSDFTSASTGNDVVYSAGNVWSDCDSLGLKVVHHQTRFLSEGDTAEDCGWAGAYIAGGTSAVGPDDINLKGFRSLRTGSSGGWTAAQEVAGIYFAGGTAPITNVTLDTPTCASTTQEYAIRRGGITANSLVIINPKLSGATVSDYDGSVTNTITFTSGRAVFRGGLTVSDNGITVTAGGLTVSSGNILWPASATMTWSGQLIATPGSGILTMTDSAGTSGVREDFTTDGVMRILTRAGGNTATLRSALGMHDTSLRVGSSAAAVNTLDVAGSVGTGAPVTKTADFTLAATENDLINNKSGSACVVTLPAASSWTGRIVWFTNYQAQQLNSNASNVVPLGGGAAGTAILSANAGRWARLKSDGTNWVIMAGVI